jgi:hypothetical protein
VLGAAGAIVLLGALLWTLVAQRAVELDAGAVRAEWFEPAELPFGLELAEAHRLARGDRVLRLERRDAEPEPPRAEPPKPEEAPPGPGEGGGMRMFDWSKVPVGSPGTPPREVAILELPLADAAKDLASNFKGGQDLAGDWKSIPPSGGRRILERGKVAWGAFDAEYLIERELEAGGTFRDVLRVNLSREGDPRVLLARWTRGSPASVGPVRALLAALPPKAGEPRRMDG